jgi:isopenicillin-N N-acyltransferase-like protein
MRVYDFQGSAAAMGEAHGETLRDEIHAFYDLRVANAIRQAMRYGGREVTEAQLLGVSRASIEHARAFDGNGFAELEGIARGADLSFEKLLALNGLTDFRDVLCWTGHLEAFGGCTSAVVHGSATTDGHALGGQTWDLATDNMPHVIGVHRQPTDGPETWSLTTTGCLTLIGMNEHGVAVGTTNVRTTDARPGVMYLSILHRMLDARDAEGAAQVVEGAHRSGAHFYWIVDGQGRVLTLECSARVAHREELTSGSSVHTNHCLVPANIAEQGVLASPSSTGRLHRGTELLEGGAGDLSMERLERLFADGVDDPLGICRDDTEGISTNGAVVTCPQTRSFRACHGLPTPEGDTWVEMVGAE